MTSVRRTLTPPTQTVIPLPHELTAEVTYSERDADTHAPTNRDLRDVFNGRLLTGLTIVRPYDIPKIQPSTLVPGQLIVFSEAVRKNKQPDPTAWVHFYEDDYRFERLWKTPEKFLDQLRGFAGVISPDFSLYRNIPKAQKIHNTFRNQLLGAWLQTNGIPVIANVRVSGRESIPYSLAGTPRHSALALGLHGCTKNVANRINVMEEIRLICDLCEPTSLVVYGSAQYGILDHALSLGIPIHVFAPDHRKRSKHREAA